MQTLKQKLSSRLVHEHFAKSNSTPKNPNNMGGKLSNLNQIDNPGMAIENNFLGQILRNLIVRESLQMNQMCSGQRLY